MASDAAAAPISTQAQPGRSLDPVGAVVVAAVAWVVADVVCVAVIVAVGMETVLVLVGEPPVPAA
jgi:hypothetical protein